MMELIRKIDALNAVLHNQGDAAVAAVQNIKPIDAVPVVRCGECKHRKTPTDYCEKLAKAYVPDEFYCKYGERKDGERDGKQEICCRG